MSAASTHWFITDRAISKPDADSFNHSAIASQLIAMVESIEPPATIGLIGGFGAGKTSIGNLLADKLKGHSNLQVVSLSAEKHTGTARQRAIVYSFAEALRDDASIDNKEIVAVLERAEEARATAGPELSSLPILLFLRNNKATGVKALVVALTLLVLMYAAGVLIALALYLSGKTEANPLVWPLNTAYLSLPIILAGFGAISTIFAAWGKAGFTPRNITLTRQRAEAPDELERVFADLVRLVKRRRLVIIVDDVDRLPPNEVLQALATIKTFQAVPRESPPIFIIACDDAIVRRAIQRRQPRN